MHPVQHEPLSNLVIIAIGLCSGSIHASPRANARGCLFKWKACSPVERLLLQRRNKTRVTGRSIYRQHLQRLWQLHELGSNGIFRQSWDQSDAIRCSRTEWNELQSILLCAKAYKHVGWRDAAGTLRLLRRVQSILPPLCQSLHSKLHSANWRRMDPDLRSPH